MIRKLLIGVGVLGLGLGGLFAASSRSVWDFAGYFRAGADQTVDNLTQQLPTEVQDRKMQNQLQSARQELIDRQVALTLSRNQVEQLQQETAKLDFRPLRHPLENARKHRLFSPSAVGRPGDRVAGLWSVRGVLMECRHSGGERDCGGVPMDLPQTDPRFPPRNTRSRGRSTSCGFDVGLVACLTPIPALGPRRLRPCRQGAPNVEFCPATFDK